MPWVPRGIRDGMLTTAWPRRADDYFDGFEAAVEVRGDAELMTEEEAAVASTVCPTGAVWYTGGDGPEGRVRLTLDRGACILCGRCVRAYPQQFAWRAGADVAVIDRRRLIDGRPIAGDTPDGLEALRARLAAKVRHLGRSVHIRHVDTGSDGSAEWEVQALTNPVYDIQRLGVFFTASPRHADMLLVTGVGAAGMVEPLRRTREAMPDPVVVIAVGTDAVSGGMVGRGGYMAGRGIGDLIDVDVWVPGAPASPFSIMHGVLTAIDRLPARARGGGDSR